MSVVRVLFIGDIVGKPGRRAVRENLATLFQSEDFDLVIANGENAAGGFGLTNDVVEELFSLGVDVITTGNHVWDKKEGVALVGENERILRPFNFPPGTPGKGAGIYTGKSGYRYLVANFIGRVFMGNYDCPFRGADDMVTRMRDSADFAILDFHGEATSEKEAFGFYLDGRVSAVVGTHTHVQTADERILPGGTGYITDVGMCGPLNSVIGMKRELILQRFLLSMPVRFEVASGPVIFSAVVLSLDGETGLCRSVERIYDVR
ncbi:MAG: TIGR00282 family metallophosphoesterase [Deltaproteobacteria bacterium]|nr:MAG: TIGR00282 family metallophosphoesterase [Deltaproteobacteria bacterium]